jgi:putative transposase
VARSHLHERVHWPTAARGSYCKAADEELLPLIRRLVDERPTYGYRRVTALVNRVPAAEGKPAANHKRVFRIMKRHGLLLQRHTGRRKGRLHDGKVVVMRSNLRRCSDVFEITCWNGEIVRIVFVIDAHDREVLAWHAVAGAGLARVVVLDEELDLTTAKLVESLGKADFEDSETLRLAKKQAGDCGDWPAWEFGW